MGNVLTQFISSSAEQLKLIIQMLKDVLFLEMGWDTVLSPLSYSYVLWLPRWPFVRTNFQLAGNFDRTGKLSDQEKIHFHTITLQEYKHLFFFWLYVFACHANTFKLLLCYFLHFDRSEERRDRAKISLVSQHAFQQSQVFFSPACLRI